MNNNTLESYGGVFLDQDYTIPGPPYYSVGAPNPNTVDGITSYFTQWTGSNVAYRTPGKDTTAVVFQSAGATATALYKGHMVSTTSDAITARSQSHVVMGPGSPRPLFAAYQSGEKLFLTMSTDHGTTWIPEQNFGNGSTPSLLPPLSVGGNLLLVWRTENGWLNFGRWNSSTQSFVQNQGVDNVGEHSPQPVLGLYRVGTEDRFYFVWTDGNGLRYRYWDGWQFIPSPPNSPWSVPGTSGWDVAPALSMSRTGSPNPVDLMYLLNKREDDFDHLRLRRMIVYSGNAQWTTDKVVEGSTGTHPRNHQVQAENAASNYAHCVWEGDPPEGDEEGGGDQPETPTRIYYQRFTETSTWPELQGNWSIATAWEGIRFRNPTIAMYAGGDIAVVWSTDMYNYRTQKTGGNWGSPELLGDGVNPALATGFERPGISDQRFLFTEPGFTQSGNPLQLVQVGPAEHDRGEPVEESYAREITIGVDETPLLDITMDEPESQGGSMNLRRRHRFSPVADTAQFRSIDELCRSLYSAPFVVSSNDSLHWLYTVTIRPAREQRKLTESGITNPVRIRLVAFDAERGHELRVLGQVQILRGRVRFKQSASLVGLEGRSIVAGVRLSDMPTLNGRLLAQMKHIHRISVDTSAATKPLAKEASQALGLPDVFAVHPNYPNPFNPSTTIKYDLPENSNVTLIVYDVLGREVAQLVNGTREAGYHSVTWSPSTSSGQVLASGVYFARFTATDASGNIKLNKVAKLLLTK